MSPCSQAFDHPLAGRGQDARAGGEADRRVAQEDVGAAALVSGPVHEPRHRRIEIERGDHRVAAVEQLDLLAAVAQASRGDCGGVDRREIQDISGGDARAHAHAADGAVGLERGQRARVELQFRTLVGPVVDDLSRTNRSSQRQCRCIVDRGCQIAGQVPVDRELTAGSLDEPQAARICQVGLDRSGTDDRAGASDRYAARVDQRASIEFDGARADGLRLVDRERARAADLQCSGRIAQLDRIRGGYRAAELQGRVHIDRQCGAAEDRVADVEGAAGRLDRSVSGDGVTVHSAEPAERAQVADAACGGQASISEVDARSLVDRRQVADGYRPFLQCQRLCVAAVAYRQRAGVERAAEHPVGATGEGRVACYVNN